MKTFFQIFNCKLTYNDYTHNYSYTNPLYTAYNLRFGKGSTPKMAEKEKFCLCVGGAVKEVFNSYLFLCDLLRFSRTCFCESRRETSSIVFRESGRSNGGINGSCATGAKWIVP